VAREARPFRCAAGLAIAFGAVGAVVLGFVGGPHRAHADTPRDTPSAIEVDRETTPAGRVGPGFDDGEPVDAWGVSIAAGWIERPIRLAAGTFGGGSPASDPVRRRQTLSLGGALALGDSVVLDAALRASHQVGDRLRAGGNPDGLARYTLHDVRLGARIRVVGDGARAAMLRADLTLPSGNDGQFAGDARWTASWGLIGRATLSDVVVAVHAGIRLHGAEVAVGDRLIGDALFAAAGVTVPLRALQLGGPGGVAERVAVTGAVLGWLGDDVGGLPGPHPFEARLGVTVRPRSALAFTVHAGLGLDDQIGAPAFRAALQAAWTPQRARRAAPAGPIPSGDLDDPEDPTDSTDPDE
jgi:hypothetical protein